MKKVISLFLLLLNLNVSAGPFIGTLTYLPAIFGYSTPTTSVVQVPYVSEQRFYISGGLVYTYPVSFTNIPNVQVSITLVNPPTPGDTYTAVIAPLPTNTSATILVYKVSSGGTVAEAATSEVLVTIFAFSN